MSRRPNLIPSVMLNVALPQNIHTQLTLHLFSELEGRVPLGAYQRFLCDRIQEFFSHRALDLAPWVEGGTGMLHVTGSPEAIMLLEHKLNGERNE